MGNLCAGKKEQPAAVPELTEKSQPQPPFLKPLPYVDPKKYPHVFDPNGNRPPSPTELEGRSHSYHKACGVDGKQKQLSVAQIDELMGLSQAKDQIVADDDEGDTVTVDTVTADDIHEDDDEENALPPPPDTAFEEEPHSTDVPTEDELASFPPPSPVVLDGHHDFDDVDGVKEKVATSGVVDDTMTSINEDTEVPPVVLPTEPDHVVVDDEENDVPPPMSPTHPEPDMSLDTGVDAHNNEHHDEPEPLYQHETTPPVSDDEEL